MTRRGVIVAALTGVLMVLGWARLRFDTDVLALLPSDLPTVRAIERHQRHFAGTQDLIVTLQGEDPDAVSSAARGLAEALRGATNRVRRAVWTAPWEERPDLTAELAAAAWLNAPPSAVTELVKRLESEPLRARLESVRETLATSLSPMDVARAGYDPLGLGEVPGLPSVGQDEGARFASEDGRFRIVLVTPSMAQRGYDRSIRWLGEMKVEMERWQASASGVSGVRWRWTGGPAIAAEVAQGMERDMRSSVAGTALIIGALFWWAHRRWRPLMGILVLLAWILGATLGFGGLFFGTINAVSLGFAAILLGLAVDYGLVLYQEARALGCVDAREIRRVAGPGVVWSAITTAAAFGMVTWSGVPGLTQLGALVAVGTLIAAAVMLGYCVPPWMPVTGGGEPHEEPRNGGEGKAGWIRWLSLGCVAMGVGVLIVRGLPRLDHTAAPLRPLNSEAYSALDEMRERLGGALRDPWWVVAEGSSEAEVAESLRRAERILGEKGAGLESWQLPTALWPDPDRQRTNATALAAIGASRARLLGDLGKGGFSAEAFRYADRLMEIWDRRGGGERVYWPTNEVSEWVLSQMASRGSGEFLALGLLRPAGKGKVPSEVHRLRAAGLLVGGWDLLGEELLGRVEGRLGWVAGGMAVIWVGSLLLALRSAREVVLAVVSTGVALLFLVASMAVMAWEWNLMNLMALPLLLGTGTDYSIHMQLALRRHEGDLGAVRRGVGRALFLCMATTVAGFGSLAWSGNAGLASLGQVCAVGLASAYGVACYLLPAWWRWQRQEVGGGGCGGGGGGGGGEVSRSPSRLYQGGVWRLGLWVARGVPRGVLSGVARLGGILYAALNPVRRAVVAENLGPVLGGDGVAARRMAWRVFGNFGRKLADLWIYEAGRPVDGLFGVFTGWEHVVAARATGRGVLLITPHLGNWEFGAPLLAKRGVPLVVITLSEPGSGFTEMRQAARARWGIETLVIGNDGFAFVEVVKRLQDGAVVALLVDRPPGGSGVEVSLFGRPFMGSVAGAELARATGCVLLPVVLPAVGTGYAAHVLEAIGYDRRALGNRDARRGLTQDILRAFEPHLRQHADQWFHFVPVWPSAPDSAR